MTGKERNAREKYRNYLYSSYYELYQAYGRCSNAKWESWERCKALMNELNGHGLKVISRNTYIFTAGFEYEEDGKEKFMYITPSYRVGVEI